MSTPVTAEAPAPEVLSILEAPVSAPAPRVNLLPAEILEQRAVRKLAKALAGAVVASAMLVGGLYVEAGKGEDQARSDLASAQAVQTSLQRQQHSLAPAKQAQTEIQNAQKALAAAMGNEVLWSRYLDQLRLTRPSGVRFTSVAFAPTSAPGAGSTPSSGSGTAGASGASAANPVAGAIATLTISGKAASQPDVAALLDKLAGIRGFTGVYLSSTNADPGTGIATYTVTAGVTADALSHRYSGDGN